VIKKLLFWSHNYKQSGGVKEIFFLETICRQNKTLQNLWLFDNQIGDAGAASIGGALAYVTPSPFQLTFFHKETFFFGATRIFWIDKGHYQVVFVSDLQPKQHVAGIVTHRQPNWRCWRCLDRWCLGVRHSFTL
jgi:hypothetical protein